MIDLQTTLLTSRTVEKRRCSPRFGQRVHFYAIAPCDLPSILHA
jgi:hypothetical protein